MLQMKPGDISVEWGINGDDILIYQVPRRGKTVPAVLLTQDEARTVAAQLTAMLATGPPVEEMEEEE